MRSLNRFIHKLLLTITGCVAITSPAFTAQPPDVVVSDSGDNTAMGTDALLSLSGGFNNTASGLDALKENTSGNNNTAFGEDALFFNSTGNNNTASGVEALYSNMTGFENTASGAFALASNTDGQNNAAFGYTALYYNNTGSWNTAVGKNALYHNTTVGYNTAVGGGALVSTTGARNVALGIGAGSAVTTGSYNIEIGNLGTARDNGIIRIGTQGNQTATYLAGVSGTHVTGAAVYVTTSGQLGILASSERYKTAVAPMGSSTAKLTQLRPVTFRLKDDPAREVQYGLIAEDVARVYPELVIRDDKGRIQGVRYEELTPMLLNEVQKQAKVIDALSARLSKLEEQQAHGSGVIDSH